MLKFRPFCLVRNEHGQSLIIVAFAIIGLIAIIGLGVDLGVVYVERVRLARAMDAAALAGAQDLPTEDAAHQRALSYLQANGYDIVNACIETHGSSLGSGSCAGSDADTVITIDTEQFREPGELGSSRIKVHARQQVPLNFVRVIGFDTMPVAAQATAENIENLDIAIVYDRSGSMQEQTRCYGCWVKGGEYPSGTTYPLPFGDHCQASDPLEYNGYQYLSIEAEHYSSYLTEADYHVAWTEDPKTWWAMQRDPNENASGTDSRGAFMLLGPNTDSVLYYDTVSDILFPPDQHTTPRLDYDFTAPVGGTYYVWIRAQGGRSDTHSFWAIGRWSRSRLHLGLNGTPMNTGSTCFWGPYNDGASGTVRKNDDVPDGFCNTGSEGWSWSRVLRLDGLSAGAEYTLNVWAAGQGFRLDKIVITNDPRTDLDQNGKPLDWSLNGVSDAGPAETHGRTGWACMGPGHATPDPRFVPIDPATGQLDDLYDDYQLIRDAKEAAKIFVRRLNPNVDQIGYVWYSNSADIVQELYCKKQFGSCDDFENVVSRIESTSAGGGTNIADAMWDGLRVLTTGEEVHSPTLPAKNVGLEHYGRSSAAHIMVLMTDGQANAYPTWSGGNCYSDDLWPDTGITSVDRARECVIWFARQARDRGVVVYTIGLGTRADHDLLREVAELTGGWYYFAPTGNDLDDVFESLYERIFLRLIH